MVDHKVGSLFESVALQSSEHFSVPGYITNQVNRIKKS